MRKSVFRHGYSSTSGGLQGHYLPAEDGSVACLARIVAPTGGLRIPGAVDEAGSAADGVSQPDVGGHGIAFGQRDGGNALCVHGFGAASEITVLLLFGDEPMERSLHVVLIESGLNVSVTGAQKAEHCEPRE